MSPLEENKLCSALKREVFLEFFCLGGSWIWSKLKKTPEIQPRSHLLQGRKGRTCHGEFAYVPTLKIG